MKKSIITLINFILILALFLSCGPAETTTQTTITTITTVTTSTTITTTTQTTTTLTTTTTTVCFSSDCDGVVVFGGSLVDGNNVGNGLVQAPDGGFIMTGFASSSDGTFAGQGHQGSSDIYLVKFTLFGQLDTSFGDGDGITLIGGSGSDLGAGLIRVSTGGYILSCYSTSNDGSFAGVGNQGGLDAHFIKITEDGQIDTSFAGGLGMLSPSGSGTDIAFNATETSDGGFLLMGVSTSSDAFFTGQSYISGQEIFIVKVTAAGLLDNSFSEDGIVTMNGTGDDNCGNVIESITGNLYMVGNYTTSDGTYAGESNAGGSDLFVAKFTASGDLDTSFGGNGILTFGSSGTDQGSRIIETSDNRILVSGNVGAGDGSFAGLIHSGNDDLVIIKLLPSGAFDITFGGSTGMIMMGSSLNETAFGLVESFDGSYLFSGLTNGLDGIFAAQGGLGSGEIIVIKLNPDGTFNTSFAGDGILVLGSSGNDYGRAIVETMNGGYAVHGVKTTGINDGIFLNQSAYTNDSYLIILDQNGNL